jgi:uncharacterized membrane protein YdjX (TVP38/TMEM64 family)
MGLMRDIKGTDELSPHGRVLSWVNGGFFLLVLSLGLAIYLTPLKTWLAEGQVIKDQLAQFGLAAPAVFTVGTALLVAIGVPRLILCSLGGMIFGFAWAIFLTQIGTVLGAYATFVFIRWRGRAYTLSHFPRLRGLSRRLEGNGFMAVLIVRQMPVNGFYNDVFLALSPVSHPAFLLGTFLGFLPLAITACLIGAGMIQADASRSVQYLILALISSAALGLLLRRLVQGRDKRNSEALPEQEPAPICESEA